MNAAPPVICFVGFSGAGKTTIVAALIERFARQGLRVGALKHDAHEFQMDREGKDTWRFRAAGACAVGIASKHARAVISFAERATPLAEMVAALPPGLALVLVEGYSGDQAPKIEVHRRGTERLGAARARGVIALVTDGPPDDTLPTFAHDDLDGLAGFVAARLAAGPPATLPQPPASGGTPEDRLRRHGRSAGGSI